MEADHPAGLRLVAPPAMISRLSPERIPPVRKQMGLNRCALTLTRGAGVQQTEQGRKQFAGKLAAMIEAGLPGLRVEQTVSARNDRRHLSGVQARLVIRDRGKRFAAIGVSESEVQHNVDAALAAGLIWLELRPDGPSSW